MGKTTVFGALACLLAAGGLISADTSSKKAGVLEAGGIVQRRQVIPTRSYLSQVELPVTFGLGASQRVDSLRVQWPGGAVQDVPVEAVDTVLTVEQQGG